MRSRWKFFENNFCRPEVVISCLIYSIHLFEQWKLTIFWTTMLQSKLWSATRRVASSLFFYFTIKLFKRKNLIFFWYFYQFWPKFPWINQVVSSSLKQFILFPVICEYFSLRLRTGTFGDDDVFPVCHTQPCWIVLVYVQDVQGLHLAGRTTRPGDPVRFVQLLSFEIHQALQKWVDICRVVSWWTSSHADVGIERGWLLDKLESGDVFSFHNHGRTATARFLGTRLRLFAIWVAVRVVLVVHIRMVLVRWPAPISHSFPHTAQIWFVSVHIQTGVRTHVVKADTSLFTLQTDYLECANVTNWSPLCSIWISISVLKTHLESVVISRPHDPRLDRRGHVKSDCLLSAQLIRIHLNFFHYDSSFRPLFFSQLKKNQCNKRAILIWSIQFLARRSVSRKIHI